MVSTNLKEEIKEVQKLNWPRRLGGLSVKGALKNSII